MGYLQIAEKEMQKQRMKFLTGNSDGLFDSDDSQKTSPASSQGSDGLLFGLPKETSPNDFNFVKLGEGIAGERSMSPVYIPPPYEHINAKRRNTRTLSSVELEDFGEMAMSKKKKSKKKKTKKKKTKNKRKRKRRNQLHREEKEREGKRSRSRSRSRRR